MRNQNTILINRNMGDLVEEPIKSNKVYTNLEQPILEDLGEGEFISDAYYNRPLVKIGGELKQMKVDSNGYVYYDTPSGNRAGQTLQSIIEQSQQSQVDTNRTFYSNQFLLSSTDFTLGNYKTLIVLPAYSTLKKIYYYIDEAFPSTGVLPQIEIKYSTNFITIKDDINLQIGGNGEVLAFLPLGGTGITIEVHYYGTCVIGSGTLQVEYVV